MRWIECQLIIRNCLFQWKFIKICVPGEFRAQPEAQRAPEPAVGGLLHLRHQDVGLQGRGRQQEHQVGPLNVNVVLVYFSIPHCRVKFAPFNSLLGQEVQHDASGRLIHEDEGQIFKYFILKSFSNSRRDDGGFC